MPKLHASSLLELDDAVLVSQDKQDVQYVHKKADDHYVVNGKSFATMGEAREELNALLLAQNSTGYQILPGVTPGMFRGLQNNPNVSMIDASSDLMAPRPLQDCITNEKGQALELTAIKEQNNGKDKFYSLRVVEAISNSNDDNTAVTGGYQVVATWGTKDAPVCFSQTLNYNTLSDAIKRFELKFRQKNGRSFAFAESNDCPLVHVPGYYQRLVSLERDVDAKDVLLTKELNSNNATTIVECVSLSFDQPKEGEFVVETAVYNPQREIKEMSNRLMYKDYSKADRRFRQIFCEYTGMQYHRRNQSPPPSSSVSNKYYTYRRGVPAAIFAGYVANPNIRTNLVQVLDVEVPLEKVDPESKYANAGSNDTALLHTLDSLPASAMLLAENEDGTSKFYSIQLVKRNSAASFMTIMDNGQGGGYAVVTRWGVVGSPGFLQEMEYQNDEEASAAKRFRSKFQEKTGLKWGKHVGSEPLDGKYHVAGKVNEKEMRLEAISSSL